MRKTFIAFLLILISFIPVFTQEVKTSQVFDFGSGFKAMFVRVENLTVLQVRFPESTLTGNNSFRQSANDDLFRDGIAYTIETAFVPALIKENEEVVILASKSPEPFYLYFDKDDKRVIITGLICESDRLCGIVLRINPKPPIF